MKKQIFKISEHQIQTEIMNYLRYHHWYVMRLNTGKYAVGEGRSRRFIMGQEAGTPDLVAFQRSSTKLYGCNVLFIEVKTPGNRPTVTQTIKMQELEDYGAMCFVATSIEDVEERIKNL